MLRSQFHNNTSTHYNCKSNLWRRSSLEQRLYLLGFCWLLYTPRLCTFHAIILQEELWILFILREQLQFLWHLGLRWVLFRTVCWIHEECLSKILWSLLNDLLDSKSSKTDFFIIFVSLVNKFIFGIKRQSLIFTLAQEPLWYPFMAITENKRALP